MSMPASSIMPKRRVQQLQARARKHLVGGVYGIAFCAQGYFVYLYPGGAKIENVQPGVFYPSKEAARAGARALLEAGL